MPVSLWSETQAGILFLTLESCLKHSITLHFVIFWVCFEIFNHMRIFFNEWANMVFFLGIIYFKHSLQKCSEFQFASLN